MPYVHGMRGLGWYVQHGLLTMLREIETNDLVFRLSGLRTDNGDRPSPYWLVDRETQRVRELTPSEVYELDRARIH